MASRSKIVFKNQNGFTLVETLITGIIAAIIAASVFVAFITYDRRSRESISFLKMQRQFDNIAEQLALDTRNARKVVATNGESCLTVGNNITASDITIYDEDCNDTAFYRISNDTLFEGGNPFQAGGGIVQVASGSTFWLPADRQGVELRLALKAVRNDTTYTSPLRKEFFKCRRYVP